MSSTTVKVLVKKDVFIQTLCPIKQWIKWTDYREWRKPIWSTIHLFCSLHTKAFLSTARYDKRTVLFPTLFWLADISKRHDGKLLKYLRVPTDFGHVGKIVSFGVYSIPCSYFPKSAPNLLTKTKACAVIHSTKSTCQRNIPVHLQFHLHILVRTCLYKMTYVVRNYSPSCWRVK